jgi:hypothetical protein
MMHTVQTPEPWDCEQGRQIDLKPNAGTACPINTIAIMARVERGTWKTVAFIPADEPEAEGHAHLFQHARELRQALKELSLIVNEYLFDASLPKAKHIKHHSAHGKSLRLLALTEAAAVQPIRQGA